MRHALISFPTAGRFGALSFNKRSRDSFSTFTLDCGPGPRLPLGSAAADACRDAIKLRRAAHVEQSDVALTGGEEQECRLRLLNAAFSTMQDHVGAYGQDW